MRWFPPNGPGEPAVTLAPAGWHPQAGNVPISAMIQKRERYSPAATVANNAVLDTKPLLPTNALWDTSASVGDKTIPARWRPEGRSPHIGFLSRSSTLGFWILTAAQLSRLARNRSSSRNAWSRAEGFPRHSAPMTTGSKSGSGTMRTLGESFALGTRTDTPMPSPLAT